MPNSSLSMTPQKALDRYAAEKSKALIFADSRLMQKGSNHTFFSPMIATYLAICAHAKRGKNANGCSPSFNRLALLTGIRKQYVITYAKRLEKEQMLTASKYATRGGRYSNNYHVDTARYEAQKNPFTFSQQLFFGGVWAFLTPSERLVWLLCRASAWYPAELFGVGDDAKEHIEAPTGELLKAHDVWFVPGNYIDVKQWAKIHGLTTRTVKDAFRGLTEKHFIWHIEGASMSGYALRVHPAIPDNFPGWAEHLANFYSRLESLR